MKRIHVNALIFVCLLLCVAPAFAQYSTFVVDDNGNPATTYPTLAAAIATAQTFAGGPHKIEIRAGAYSDADLYVTDTTKIGEIYGDPSAAAGDIVFTSPSGTHNFLHVWTGLNVHHFKVVGYKGTAFYGVAEHDLKLNDLVIRGASGIGLDLSGTKGALVDGLALSKLDYGIYGNGVQGVTIQNSTIDTCGYGVDMANLTVTPLIDNLTITGGNYGIYLDGGTVGAVVQNCSISKTAQQGIYLASVGGSDVYSNMLYRCGNYGVFVASSTTPNFVMHNCFVENLGGTSQGYDNAAIDTWSDNYYSDHVYAQNGGAVTDAAPKEYALSATAAAASYNIGDTVTIDFNWAMPACAALDSARMAAYSFTVTYTDAQLQYVPASAKYDEAYLGPAPPALYTGIDASTPGQLTFGAANFTAPGYNGGRLGYARFVVVGANAITTLGFTGVDFRDPANVALLHGVNPLALTLVDNVNPVLVSVAANNPAGDNTYSDGSTAGPGPFTKLFLTLHGTDNYDLKTFWYRSDGGAWNLWMAAAGTNFTSAVTQYNFVGLGLGEGTHTAGIRVEDMAGNFSNEIIYTYKIDRTAPVITSVAISDADGCALNNSRWTNNPTVTLAIVSDGTASQMMVSESGDQPIIPFAASSAFVMTSVNGVHTVWARLYDKYNNRIDWTASNTITLDNVAPIVTGPLVISGSPKTATKNVQVTISDFGMGGYYGDFGVTEAPANFACGNAVWKSLTPANYGGSGAAFALSNGDGVKTVSLAARDSAGNISNVVSGTITLDQTAPVLNSYTLTSLTGTSCSPDGSVKAVYTWSGTDAAKLQYSYNDTTWGDWKTITGLPSPDSTTGVVPNTPGVHKVYVRLLDDVGNISNEKVASVTVDNAAPTVVAALCVDNASTATPDPIYPGGVTNSLSFTIRLTTVSSNVTAVAVSQNLGVTWSTYAATPTGGTINLPYTWTGTPAQCAWNTLQVKVRNCAGTESAVLTPQVYFDLTGPTVSALTGPALTNVLAVTLNITATDNCGLYQMRLADGATTGKPWIPFNPTPGFTLNTGDGNHTVNLDVADYGGNIASKSVTIKVDMTAPTGTVVLKSSNAAAAPGWTDSQSGIKATVTWGADTKYMAFRNADGSSNTGWIAPSSPYSLVPILGGIGLDTVQFIFQDSAGNTSVGGWQNATITYDPNAPAPPAAAIGTPVASTLLKWTKVANGQKYYIRYNFQNQYPTYQDSIPPHPNTFAEGIYAGEVADTFFTFAGPHPDIYSFSIWTLGKNGHYSVTSNQNVTATNYLLGDFSPAPDGCLKFGAEFGALAVAYNSVLSDPNFNDSLDIAPTSNAKTWGYPMPDKKIDFEDLVIFALNYDAHHCASSTEEIRPTENRTAASAMPIAVQVTVPGSVTKDAEIVIPVQLDNFAEVRGYHVVLNYNTNDFDLVRVEPGNAYTSVAQSFFYYDKKSPRIDVSGVVMGTGVNFTGGEFFRVVLRARNTGDINISGDQLTFRDSDNNSITASLGVLKTATLPTVFALSQNYPNPFNPTTTIQLSLPVASDYKLTIFNVLGQSVKTFVGHAEAGDITIDWDASGNSSGIYLYKVEAGSFTATKKMVLLK